MIYLIFLIKRNNLQHIILLENLIQYYLHTRGNMIDKLNDGHI